MSTTRTATAGTAVLFDLDGTLVDSEPNYYEAGRRLLATRGVTLTWEQHERYVGISTRETLTDWRERYGLREEVADLLAEQDRIYLGLARTSTEAYPRMRELVELLHVAGVPLAVASGSSREAIGAVLAGTGLADRFTLYVSADEVARGKPAPDVFLETARRLGTAAADCVVLEDSGPGVRAARAAGMRCVAIPYLADRAQEAEFTGADLLFRGGQAEFTATTAFRWIADRTG